MSKKNPLGWVVALLLVAAAVACSSSSSSPPTNGTGTNPTGTSTGQGTVGTSGGQVTTSDGVLTVTVPAGALPADTQITITEIQAPAAGAIGKSYDIGPTGTQFASPVTLAFNYAGVDLQGNDPSSLEVSTVVGGAWIALAGDAVDTTAQIATGQTTHLSPYGLQANAVDSGASTDATVSNDDGSSASDSGQAADTGISDAGFDATGCMAVAQQVGSCANHPVQICQAGQTFTDCVDVPNKGWSAYCCP